MKFFKETYSVVGLIIFAFLSRVFLLFLGWLSFSSIHGYQHEPIHFSFNDISDSLSSLSQADFDWYKNIALDGYEQRPFTDDRQANWAFYPLWPLILRVGNCLFHEIFYFGLIICNLCFLAIVFFLYKLLRLDFNEQITRQTIVFLILSPFSYYFFRPGPESLFLLLTVISLYFAKKGNWFVSSFFASLSTLTRLQGVLLTLPLIYIYFSEYCKHRKILLSGSWLLLIPASFLGFMIYLYSITGNFFASFQIQRAWGNTPTYPLKTILEYLKAPVLSWYSWDFSFLTISSIVFSSLLIVVMLIFTFKKVFPLEYLIFSFLHLLVNVSRTNLIAGSRYMMIVFPLFLALSMLVRNKQILNNTILFCFVSMLTCLYLAAIHGYNWALA